ncbi:hypothetical protein LPY66_12250 [Dehalobacter sp. DCM]|uniref:NifB/NifX family molybdenum-iron cluster-binding protein n=1 Tax=Dehalobacter sp. DCM TaxID=2907827 RepID=UPI0030820AFC|nr:hypothetical protein LPY66_12250 [Dehalobacter sp. DCM]
MKIAVAVNGNMPDSIVSEAFEASAFLLVSETDDMSFEVFENPEGTNGHGMAMVNKILEQDCEALISGTIEEDAFEALAAAQVTRYFAAGHTALKALALMDAYELDIIREYNGKEWIPHDHSQETCDCGHHDDEAAE